MDIPLICLLAAGLVLAAPAAQAAEALALLEVRPQVVDIGWPAEAVVEAVQQATVGAQVAGRILEVRADAGQRVARGEVLMRLDAREATEALRAAEARYANARQTFERTRSLVDRKFMSAAALDRARADVEAAAADRAAAGAGRSHATIVAPLAGIVARRHAEVGDLAMPGKPLFTIYRPDGLRVTANVPQSRLPDMRGMTAARVEFPELGRRVEARSVQLLPTADAATHSVQVRVLLPELPEATPGMYARVHFVTGRAEKLAVPASAVLRRGEVAAVYVQGGDGRLSLRQLRLGEAVGPAGIEVLAGLAGGEKIAPDAVKAGIALKQPKDR